MSINTKPFQDAYTQYRSDVAKAVTYTHHDLTHTGATRQRHARVMQARSALINKIPSAPDPAVLQDRRPAVIESLAPKNADQVAVQGAEWAKVQAILKSGRVIQQAVMDTTSVERLAAIANNVEIWAYGLNTNDPEGFAEDVRSLVFDRLVALGHEGAVGAQSLDETFRTTAAWNKFLTDTIEGNGNASIQALYQVDPEGYAAVQAANFQFNLAGDTDDAVKRLDSLVSKPLAVAEVI
ncbi:hypothetical protein [Cryobacterium sp. BB307]|uniref:hypothetical protein n=1 Tax=Cryobacterium sp. BB307 TaxID=2716317 RepID=UPI0014476A72|nr:hypothetical protein [Cryobacterium sp. BB307]